MKPTKRKINDIIFEEDSLKCRRSSLTVNLSCASNLTDSGNGSLRQTENACENVLTSNGTAHNEVNKIHCVNLKESNNSSNNTRLKNVKVVLENIQSTEQFLDKKRKQLEKTVLNKTKEMFNINNELPVKTKLVLEVGSSETINNSGQCSKQNDIVNSCEITTSFIHKSLTSKTMKNIDTRSVIHNHVAKVGLAENDINEDNKNVSDNSKLKRGKISVIRDQRKTGASNTHYNTMKSLCIKPKEKHSSPVISGSNKKLIHPRSKVKRSKKLFQDDKRSNLLVTHNKCLNESSISSISEDENLSMGLICSSTPLLNDKQSVENDMANYPIQEICEVNTKASEVSMEITDMRGGFIMDNETDHRNVSDEESIAAVHTSLHVNTSIDVYDENTQRARDYRREQAFGKTTIQENDEEHTLQTTHLSLHMNTSLCTLDLEKRDRSNRINNQTLSLSEENRKNIVDIQSDTNVNSSVLNSSLDNMSLIERLRNISIPNTNQKSKSITEQSCTLKSVISSSQSESQLNLNTATQAFRTRNLQSSRNNETIGENDISDSIGDYPVSRNHTQAKEATMAITSADPSNEAQGSINSLDTVIISDNIKNTKNKNDVGYHKIIVPKRNKKKLLPLSENSRMVSLTPNEEISTPEDLMPRKNWRKKKKKQLNKMHINVHKEDIQPVEKSNFVRAGRNSCIESHNDLEVSQGNNEREKQNETTGKKETANKIISDDMEKFQKSSRGTTNVKIKLLGLKRNSSIDFQFKEKGNEQRRVNKKIVLVATGLSKEDKDLVKCIVKTLRMARLEANVSKRTTHVVSTGVRTLNLLHGIIRGCWLVSMEWVLKSLENNGWLRPEEFEMVHFSKAVTENRKDRQLFGPAYVPELFAACGCIYVESGTVPPCNVLKDLIKAAGGRITDNLQIAKVVIGKKGIRESWVLDCITTGELQLCNKYKRH